MTWDDGSPQIGKVFSPKLAELLGPERDVEDPEFFGKWADIAHSAQVVYEEIFFHVVGDLQQADRARQAVARGRVRAELGRERQAVRTYGVPGAVRPARGRRRRDGDRRRLLRRARGSGAPAAVRHARRLHRSGLRRRRGHQRHRGAPARNGWDSGIDVRRLDDGDLYRQVAQAVAAGKVVGLVPGADGVRAARAGQPIDRRRSAPRRHEGHPQHRASSTARPTGRSRPACWRRRPRTSSNAASRRRSC